MKIADYLKISGVLLGIALVVLLSACGGGGGGGGGSDVDSLGTLKTSLTDNATEKYRGIYISVAQVKVKPENGDWQTVAEPQATYNLLELVNGVRETLGISQLDAGHYTQLRLFLVKDPYPGKNLLGDDHPKEHGNYLIDLDDNYHLLTVPSGFTSGFKVVHGFDITNNETTELILDFDALASVVEAGNSGKHLLKPVVKVLRTENRALVTGTVTDGATALGIGGALVSAQSYNGAVDVAERVQVERSTIAAGDDTATPGEYQLTFLEPGSYNLLAQFTGDKRYEPVCRTVTLAAGEQRTEDFTLTETQTGSVEGMVDITSNDASTSGKDLHVTLDFRQTGLCTDPGDMVSIKKIQVADEETYSVELPVGTYQVVSSTEDRDGDGEPDFATQQQPELTVNPSAITPHNPAF